jgi:hypothetical protein
MLKSRLHRSQRRDEKADLYSHPDAVEAHIALSYPRKRLLFQLGNCVYFTVKKYMQSSNISRDKDVELLFDD